MDEHGITRKISNWTPASLHRPEGRRKERWLDREREDLKIMAVLDWKNSVSDRKKMARLT
jgi:hypothetical protein